MGTDRFTKMQKVAIFLIALGEERTREILADVDLDTVEQLNGAMSSLGRISAEEKAGVMLEFAHFFYDDKPITSSSTPGAAPAPTAPAPPSLPSLPVAPTASKEPTDLGNLGNLGQAPASNTSAEEDEERAILHTLEHLRRRLDPAKIDWGRAGYDFGDGFKGPSPDRR